jgi:hypothetical protein
MTTSNGPYENVDVLKGARIQPYKFVQGRFVGGIDANANCDKGRMQTVKGFRDDSETCSNAAVRLAGRYLYAGPLWNHFGHILVDSLHRLWAFDNHDAVVFTGVVGLRGVSTLEDLQTWNVPSLVEPLLRLMGIDAPVVIVRDTTEFETLDVPELGAFWKGGVKSFYKVHLERYQAGIAEMTTDVEVMPKIYYPRTHLLSAGGIVGSSYFEEALRDNGYDICRPEELDLKHQLANLLKAEEIVFDEGSSVHLTELMAKVAARAFMFPRRASDRVFKTAFRARGSEFHALTADDNIRNLKDRNGNMSPAMLTYYVDPEKVYTEMLNHKIVRRPFDIARFIELERSDLLSCAAHSKLLRAERLAILETLRKRN